MHSSSTGTPPVEKMDCHQHKNYSAIQYRILFLPTVNPLYQSGRDPVKKPIQSPHIHQKHSSPPMINMLTPCPTFRSAATMLRCRTPPPNCGTSTELSQQLDYFIKTQSGCILVRNRSLSIAGPSPILPPNPPEPRLPEPRRSARTFHRPLRLSNMALQLLC